MCESAKGTSVRKYPFLPADPEIGWIPYLWLLHLFWFWSYAFFAGPNPVVWLVTAAGTAAFLPLYFLGYTVRGRRALVLVLTMWGIGLVCWPWNHSALVFFVYATASAAHALELRVVLRFLPVLFGAMLLEAWAVDIPFGAWSSAVVLCAIIAPVTIVQAQRRKMNVRLVRAQDEIEQLARIAERERIARDLHDVLGHTLSLIVLKSELASRLAEKDPARAKDEIQQVERISREALAEVRSAVRGYRTLALVTEVTKATSALESAGIEVRSEIEDIPMSPAQETAVAMALREAVTNIVRHSGATQAQIALRRIEDACVLSVADDGQGGQVQESWGLAGMRERVHAVGGTLERDGSRGMRLVIRLPLLNGTAGAA